jgi:hypothetical protein
MGDARHVLAQQRFGLRGMSDSGHLLSFSPLRPCRRMLLQYQFAVAERGGYYYVIITLTAQRTRTPIPRSL